jgi:hypothetical protein
MTIRREQMTTMIDRVAVAIRMALDGDREAPSRDYTEAARYAIGAMESDPRIYRLGQIRVALIRLRIAMQRGIQSEVDAACALADEALKTTSPQPGADGMTAEDDRRFLELTGGGLMTPNEQRSGESEGGTP